jgi:O-6-methylguanine DNA methyltransferase
MSETVAVASLPTPLGPIYAYATDYGICALEFAIERRQALLAVRLNRWYSGASPIEKSVALHRTARRWLERYFAGEFPASADVSIDMRGSPFELSVWTALMNIPAGQTTTYGELSKRLGRLTGARAVGAAVGRNPIGIIVPCHRVVAGTGSLTGYGGGLERKRWLLQHEAAARP